MVNGNSEGRWVQKLDLSQTPSVLPFLLMDTLLWVLTFQELIEVYSSTRTKREKSFTLKTPVEQFSRLAKDGVIIQP